jgi:O-antigen/teichoic acid export membrane protein
MGHVEPAVSAPKEAERQQADFARSALWVLGGNVGMLGLGYLASLVTARLLGASARGLVAVMEVGADVAVGLLGVGVPAACIYYGSRRRRLLPTLLGNALLQSLGLTVVALAVGFLAAGALHDRLAPAYDERLWYLAAALVPLMFLDYTNASLLTARFAFRLRSVLQMAGRAASLIAAIVLIGVLGWGVAGALVAMMSSFVVGFAGAARLQFSGGVRLSRLVAVAMVRYGVRVQIGRLLQTVNARFDVLVLAALAPLHVVGSYAIAQIVAELVLLLSISLGTVLTPTVAAARGADRTRDVIRLGSLLAVAGIIGVGIGGPLLILIGYGPAFRPALVPFAVLLPGMWFLSMGSLCGDGLRGRGRPGVASLIAVAEVIVTIALDLLLIPPYGAVGAAVASVCAYAVFGVAGLAVIARQDGVPFHAVAVPGRSEVAALFAIARRLRPAH